MKRMLILFCALGLTLGCSKQSGETSTDNSTLNETPKGTRTFDLDDQKPAFELTLVGVVMGVPTEDYQAVLKVIQDALLHGVINHIVPGAQPIEGGINSCVVVNNAAARKEIIKALQSVQTSDLDSHYSIKSVDSCP